MKTNFRKSPRRSISFLLATVFVVVAGFVALFTDLATKTRAQSSVKNLSPKYSADEVFSVPNTDINFTIDIEGFELTHDRQITAQDLLTVGHVGRRVVLKVTYDTLYTDLEATPGAYEDLWWYFYAQDSTLDIGRRRNWSDSSGYWSTHTLMTSYGLEINEKHYDRFVLEGGHYFHIMMKRPMYLEGDSTFMLQVMSSFKFIPGDSADSTSD